jgi:hypothetical protein
MKKLLNWIGSLLFLVAFALGIVAVVIALETAAGVRDPFDFVYAMFMLCLAVLSGYCGNKILFPCKRKKAL